MGTYCLCLQYLKLFDNKDKLRSFETFLIINKLDAAVSQIYSWNETLHVSESFPVHHQEFFTVHTAMVHVIKVCWQQAVSKPVWHIPFLCVQRKTPDDGQGNCPKHVEFHSKNKFVKLVHLVGFIIRNLTLRLLMSYIYIYIYGEPILDVSRLHTTTHHSR